MNFNKLLSFDKDKDDFSNDALKIRLSLDSFAGLLFGNFPSYSPLVYRAIVNDLKVDASVNLTLSVEIEYLNLAKVKLEVDFVPILVAGGLQSYTTSALSDNCFWLHGSLNVLQVHTRLSKTFARCERNLKNLIQRA